MISLLATPLVLGLINLIDAYVDKEKAIYEGDQLYRTEVESGKAEVEAILAQAIESADAKYGETTAGAKQEAGSILTGAMAVAQASLDQGEAESKLTRLQAERLRQAVQQILRGK